MVCQVQLLLPSDTEYRGPLEIEASEKFHKSGKALEARSLTDAGEKVLLRLMNVSCNPQTVYKNTVVGSTLPVVNIIKTKSRVMTCTQKAFKAIQMSSPITSKLNMNSTQGRQRKLVTFSLNFNINFKYKDDFGRTSVTKHKINTENAKSTKHPPRRLPHPAADFIDKEVENMIDKGIAER